MSSELIAFKVDIETYLKLEALASEKGTSVSLYVKDKTVNEVNSLVHNINEMQIDLNDIILSIRELREDLANPKSQSSSSKSQEDSSAIIEILMILREIAQPSKLSSAQKKVVALGLEVFKSWGK